MGYSKPISNNHASQAPLLRQKGHKNKPIFPNLVPSMNTPRISKKNQAINSNNINALSWNLNTLASDEAMLLLQGSIHGHNPNILCIQESRITEDKLKCLEIAGFKIFGNPAASTIPKKGQDRGLITAVSHALISEVAPKASNLILGPGIESLAVDVKTSEGTITIHNIYVHQDSVPISLNLKMPKGKHLLLGDFNSRHHQWEPITGKTICNKRGNRLYKLIEESSDLVLCNTQRVPTTTDNHTLTLSLISAELAVATDWSVLEDCVASPHIATLTSVKLKPNSPLPPFKPKLLVDKANWPQFNQITNIPLTCESFKDNNDESLEPMVSDIVSSIHTAIDSTIPYSKHHDRIPPCEQWWFGEKSKFAKQELHKAVQDNRRNAPGARAKLRQVRAKTLETFQLEKHEKWNAICQSLNLSSSLGSHWRRLRWLYNGGIPPQPALMEISKAKHIADEAMTSFSERSHPKNLRITTQLVLEELQREREEGIEKSKSSFTTLCSSPFLISELERVLKPHKSSAPGEDNIPYIVLANLGQAYRTHLVQLVNKSFHLIRSPSQWKTVPIIPVPKKNKGEFRPIALLSCIGKIMEHMILNRLKHIVGPLHPNLMGCTQGKGTTDAIASFANIVSDAKHNRSGPTTNALKFAFAIFIDYVKAFELANSTVILSVLCEEKGVVGNMLGWLQDYLTGRYGYTTVLGQKSDIMPLHQGTPQGSVLSPFLFNILMDKLIRIIYSRLPEPARSKVTILSYADDIVLVCNNFAAKHLLALSLDILESASTLLGLQVNISKTKAMAWNHSHKFPDFQFAIYKGPIEWVRTFKYLGVTFDDSLSFNEHVDDVIIRVNSRLNILKHLASCPYGATQRTLLSYYKTCIRPILEYGSIILCIACPSAIKRLESVQNTALKIALRLPKHARSQLVRIEADCPSIEDRCNTLASSAFAKIKSFGNSHPYFQGGKQMHTDPDVLGKKPNHPRDIPLDMVLNNMFNKLNIQPLKAITLTAVNPMLPSPVQPIRVDLASLCSPKSIITPTEKVILCDSIIDYIKKEYVNYFEIYVDGSVDPDTGRASAAYTSPGHEEYFELGARISDGVCSTQAELAAIHLVLKQLLITHIPINKVVIHCDSQSAIKTIQRNSPDQFDNLSVEIINCILKLSINPNFHMTLHWIPSHIGIPGNERADSICEKARLLNSITYQVPISLGQIKSSVRKYYRGKVKEELAMSGSTGVQKYLYINPSLKPLKSKISNPLIQAWLNRFRLETDTYCFIHNNPVLCNYCQEAFSATHYLTECPVTGVPSFLEPLTTEEHSYIPQLQTQTILFKMDKGNTLDIFSKYLLKRPPKICCPHQEHGLIRIHTPNIAGLISPMS